MTTFDVIVLGLGGMGTAAAAELARRGRRVLGLEQFNIAHDRGSSHGQTRIIRKAYYEHPCYVPLLHRAYERWYDLEQRQGKHLFTTCGLLSIGAPESELVSGVRRSAAEHALPVDHLSADDLRRRFPQFRYGYDVAGILEKEAGFLYVEDCVRAHAEEARRLGATLHHNEPVVSWEATATGVTVQTAGRQYHAARLVITAGAWASRVLADLGLPLTVRRKALLWLATADDQRFRRDVFPLFMSEQPTGFYYGFPVLDGHGLKVARHDGGLIVDDPAAVDRSLNAEDEHDIRTFLSSHLPEVNGPVRHAKICLYTLTPDQHFILDVHPAHPHVALAAGFSGHGFKFASAVGEILADLADRGTTSLPIDMFRLGRFAATP